MGLLFVLLLVFMLLALLLFVLATNLVSTSSAFAVAPTTTSATKIKSSKGWTVYKTKEGTIFMSSGARSQSGTFSKREEPFLMVSCFNRELELSVYTGYEYKEKSEVSAVIYMSNKDPGLVTRFKMTTSGQRAWVADQSDKAVMDKLRLGGKVVITGNSTKNTNSIDEYSLDGFSDAYKTVAENCIKQAK